MLEIKKIRKTFDSVTTPVLDDVSLRIEEGECLSLLGPSGCGKTTLLRILAGFETPDSGELLLDGKDLIPLRPAERPFHMVFQKHALFPHLNVYDNVAFGLRVRKAPEAEIRDKVKEALALVRLENFGDRRPATLSGGQSQRVALARALVNRPRVLLLDEPFSALDLKLREGMATELRDLQKRLRLTFVFVTHDQQEAFALSDRVALMNGGHFEQIAVPREIYEQPASFYAAHFVGSVSRIKVDRLSGPAEGERISFQGAGSALTGHPLSGAFLQRQAVALVRPEAFRLQSASAADNKIEVRVKDRIFRGSHQWVRAEAASGCEILFSVRARSPDEVLIRDGASVSLYFSPEDTLLCEPSESAT